MDQIGALIDSLGIRLTETNTVVGGLSTKLDQLEAVQHLADARTVMLEENAERIISLQKHCDVSGSGWEGLGEVSGQVEFVCTPCVPRSSYQPTNQLALNAYFSP